MNLNYYEVSLKIKKVDKDHEKSYYEVWNITPQKHRQYYAPIVETVFKREVDKLIDKHIEPNDQYIVLLDDSNGEGKDCLFKQGRKLIRKFLFDNNIYFLIRD